MPSTSVGTDTVTYLPTTLNPDASAATDLTVTTEYTVPDGNFTATATPAVRDGAGLRISVDNSTQTPQRDAQYRNLE